MWMQLKAGFIHQLNVNGACPAGFLTMVLTWALFNRARIRSLVQVGPGACDPSSSRIASAVLPCEQAAWPARFRMAGLPGFTSFQHRAEAHQPTPQINSASYRWAFSVCQRYFGASSDGRGVEYVSDHESDRKTFDFHHELRARVDSGAARRFHRAGRQPVQ